MSVGEVVSDAWHRFQGEPFPFHPSKRQPLPRTQKLREGIRVLSSAVIAMRDRDGSRYQGEESTDSSVLD